MFKRSLIVCATVVVATSATTQAALVGYELSGQAGTQVSSVPTTVDANLTATGIIRGSGAEPTGLVNAVSSNNFFFIAGSPAIGGTLADAIRENEFYELSVSPKPGATLSLSVFDLNYRRSGAGPTGLELQYSLDGFVTAGTTISNFTSTNSDTNGIKQPTIDLVGISALQNLSGSTATFRLYMFGATTTTGTGAIGRLAGDDLSLSGTVSVPEPSSLLLVASAGLLALRRRRTV